MAGVSRKITTGLTGLKVIKEPHEGKMINHLSELTVNCSLGDIQEVLATKLNLNRYKATEKLNRYLLNTEMLKVLYEKTLIALNKIPATAAYRVNTEQIVRNRMQHVLTERDVQVLEQKIDGGQIEEVILQAQRELALARKMIEWKPWEPLVAQAPKNQWKWPI